MEKRVVLLDIAKELGVSKNTVSRALRDCKDISEDLKIKIKNKANEMGYIPNALSIFFRENSSRLVGIVTSDLINPYYSIHIDSIIKSLSSAGFVPVTILTSSGYLDFEVLKSLLNYQVCSIVSFQDYSKETYEFLKDKKIPVVLYGLMSQYENVPYICTDDYEGGRLVGYEYVNSHKYTNPCMIAWQEDVETFQRRKNGFVDILKQYNIDVPIYVVGYGNKEKFNCVINNKHDFVFSYCDALGIELKDYLKEIKYKCKVYGFDGISYYNDSLKKIRSVSSDLAQMSSYLTDQILNYVNNNSKIVSKIFPVKLKR